MTRAGTTSSWKSISGMPNPTRWRRSRKREPARILVAIGDKDNDSLHLEYKQR
jgi:hypothetical protein